MRDPQATPPNPAEIDRAKVAGWWAVIMYKQRETCPFQDSEPELRAAWLASWNGAYKRVPF